MLEYAAVLGLLLALALSVSMVGLMWAGYALALASAFLAGWGMAPNPRFGWVHAAALALITSVTIYVIVDLELPRFGLFRVDAADALLHDLRRTME